MSNTSSNITVAAVGATALHALQQSNNFPGQAELFYFDSNQNAFAPLPNRPSPATISDQAKAVLFISDLSDVSELEKAMNASEFGPETFKVAIVIAPEQTSLETINSTLQPLASIVDSYIVLKDPAKESDALLTATKAVREVIYTLITIISERPQDVMVDFEDLKHVLTSSKKALTGIAEASGTDRVKEAVKKALTLPFMPEVLNQNCSTVLLNITSGEEADLEMEELTEITEVIQEYFGEEAELIFGHGIVPEMKDKIRLEIVASVELVEVCNAERV